MANPNIPNYGATFKCLEDLDPLLILVEGEETMGQVVLHRLYTPVGAALSDPTAKTLDLRDYVGKAMDEPRKAILIGECIACLVEDERIYTADVEIDFNPQANSRLMHVRVTGQGAWGPFALTLAVTQLTVELLRSA